MRYGWALPAAAEKVTGAGLASRSIFPFRRAFAEAGCRPPPLARESWPAPCVIRRSHGRRAGMVGLLTVEDAAKVLGTNRPGFRGASSRRGEYGSSVWAGTSESQSQSFRSTSTRAQWNEFASTRPVLADGPSSLRIHTEAAFGSLPREHPDTGRQSTQRPGDLPHCGGRGPLPRPHAAGAGARTLAAGCTARAANTPRLLRGLPRTEPASRRTVGRDLPSQQATPPPGPARSAHRDDHAPR